MKVLAIAKTLTKGGAASGARNTIRALESAGAEVVALDGFAAQRAGKHRLVRTVERAYERLVHRSDVHCICLARPTFDLQKVCQKYNPDIVQMFDVSGNTISFDDMMSVPVPIVQRMSDFWPYNGAHHYAERRPSNVGLAEWLLRHTVYSGQAQPDLLVAPSHWLASHLPIGPKKVIRNAVAIQEHASPRGELGRPLRLGFIANPVRDPRKGVMSLGPVLDALAADIGPIELHLFGEGSERGVPVGAAVAICPHPAFVKNEIRRVYAQFDILLCPSFQDNSPNVLTEALSFAVPVVAQAGTGMDTYVEANFGALVNFHAGPAEIAAKAIGDLVSRYSAASGAAFEFARQKLSPARIGAEYLAAYEELLQFRVR